MIEAKETITGNITSSSTLNGSLNKAIEYIAPTTQEKTITPKKEQQIVVPDDGVFALSKVTVEEIPSEYVEVAGTLDITTNGEYDVKQYEKANVIVGGLEITNASYLFYQGARENLVNELCSFITNKCQNFYRFYSGNSSNMTLTTLPSFDTSNGTNFSEFISSPYITELPHYDTSEGIYFDNFICSTKVTTLPLYNTGKGTSFTNFLLGNSELIEAPPFDFSNGTSFGYAFGRNTSLVKIPLLDLGKATSVSGIVNSCTSLTTLGGFKDLGKAYRTTNSANYSSYKLDLSASTLLTHESLMNVINNLYDIAGKGCKTQSLVLGATNIAKLTEEEIAIATNKGWTVS